MIYIGIDIAKKGILCQHLVTNDYKVYVLNPIKTSTMRKNNSAS